MPACLACVILMVVMSGCVCTSTDLENLYQELNSLSWSPPEGVHAGSLDVVLSEQRAFLESIDAFNRQHFKVDIEPSTVEYSGESSDEFDRLVDERRKKYEAEEANEGRGKSSRGNFLNVDIHVDVVFLGYPEEAIDHIKDEWFEGLARDHPLRARLQGELMNMPGTVKLHSHFHLVQVSESTSEVVHGRLQQLVREAGDSQVQNVFDTNAGAKAVSVNAWEIEEMLADLTTVVSASHRGTDTLKLEKPALPVLTVYVFNADMTWMDAHFQSTGPNSYRFHGGFLDRELKALADDALVVARCREVLDELLVSSRTNDAASSKSGESLSRSAMPDIVRRLLQDGAKHDDEKIQQTQRRDAVHETDIWAQAWRPLLERSSRSLAERALHILNASPKITPGIGEAASSLYAMRVPLAKAVLSLKVTALDKVGVGTSSRNTLCSAQTWVSGRDFAWIDTQAASISPLVRDAKPSYETAERAFSEGESPFEFQEARTEAGQHSPVPRQLRKSEVQQLGVDSGDRDQYTKAILRHYSALSRIISRQPPGKTALCPPEIIQNFKEQPKTNEFGTLEALFADLSRKTTQGLVTPACSIATHQLALLSAAIGASSALDVSIGALEMTESSTGAVLRAKRLQIRTLAAVLKSSGVLHGIPHVKVGQLTGPIRNYLSYICAAVVDAAVELAFPPSMLHPALASSSSKGIKQVSVPSDHGLLDVVIGSAALEDGTENGWNIDRDSDPLPDLAKWSRLLPPLAFPVRIEIVVYVVRLQKRYEPVIQGSSIVTDGLDYRLLNLGLSKLRLRNQDLTVTLHTIDPHATSEDRSSYGSGSGSGESIELAVASCLRHTIYENVVLQESNTSGPRKQQYIDSSCVWAHLQRYDIDTPSSATSITQHIPVFVLSLDTNIPTFATSSLAVTATVGLGVLAVQNHQTHVDAGRTCGGQVILLKGRDPSGAILSSVASLLTGIAPKVHDLCGDVAVLDGHSKTHSSSYDIRPNAFSDGLLDRLQSSSYHGSSPSFESQTVSDQAAISFADYEIIASLRARSLRLLGATYVLMRKKLLLLRQGQDRQQRLNSMTVSVSSNVPTAHGLAHTLVHLLEGLQQQVELCSASRDGWEATAAAANAAYFAIEDWVRTDVLHKDLVAAALEASFAEVKKQRQERASAASSSGSGGDKVISVANDVGALLSWDILFWPLILALLTFFVTINDWGGVTLNSLFHRTSKKTGGLGIARHSVVTKPDSHCPGNRPLQQNQGSKPPTLVYDDRRNYL